MARQDRHKWFRDCLKELPLNAVISGLFGEGDVKWPSQLVLV